jgi:hypothetical protein
MQDHCDNDFVLNEAVQHYRADSASSEGSMLDESLAMTPWERILANDDMVNFGNMLRTAMEKRNAEPG